jgi:arylsulfatase A-like enzyme
MWNRREVIAAGAVSSALQAHRQARRRPNFLFLLADDHAGYALGAENNQHAITPNLDSLAAAGTRFAAHFCNSPVCTPSRQSFLTGQLPHAAGVTRLQTRLSENKPTLARQFVRAGYRTGVIGKMHFNRPGTPGLHGFHHLVTEPELNRAWAARVPKPTPLPAGARTKPGWKPFRDPARIWLNAEKLPYPRMEAEMRAATQLAVTEEFLQAHRDQAFALWVSFLEPHSPYDFPYEDRDRIAASSMTPPRAGPEDGWQIPLVFRDLSEAEKQGIAAAYYTSVAYLDRNIGKVLAMLQRLHLDESTLVVYMADHGYCLGHHGRFEKHCGYDQALRVPLIFRWPGRVREGHTVNEFTESVDVPATITDLLGLESLPVQHGQSLREYLEGGAPARKRDHICSSYHENEEAFVRTARWKYIYCTGKRKRNDGYLIDNPTPGPYRRLYDLQRDPGEFTDVARQNPKVVRELHQLLVDRFRRTHPDAASEPKSREPLDFYLPPRDA